MDNNNNINATETETRKQEIREQMKALRQQLATVQSSNFGTLLATVQKDQNLSQAAMAEAMGVSLATYRKYAVDGATVSDGSKLAKYAAALGLPETKVFSAAFSDILEAGGVSLEVAVTEKQ